MLETVGWITMLEALFPRIVLNGGKVTLYTDSSFGPYFTVSISVRDRARFLSRLPEGTSTVTTQRILNERVHTNEFKVLREVQQAWSSLWAHESLETFALRNVKSGRLDLIFDPHCKDALDPAPAGFLTDETGCAYASNS